jgi:hypothetical protein
VSDSSRQSTCGQIVIGFLLLISASALCGTSGDEYDVTRMWEWESVFPVSSRDLPLFTLDTSPEILVTVLFEDFFPFVSEFVFPDRPLQERGLINLELAGPEID